MEWYAVEVSGSVSDLTLNLNTLEKQGYDIHSVVIAPKGWTVVASKVTKQDVPVGEREKPEEMPRRGTVALHKGHKK